MTAPAPSALITCRHTDELIVGLVSTPDHALAGTHQDEGIPALRDWLGVALSSPWQGVERLIPDDQATITEMLIDLVDHASCDLVLTTGGTGPTRRDATPEATLAVATKEMPGFGEQICRISLHLVPTTILSRQVAVIRETPSRAALIIGLPGQPRTTKETLEDLKDVEGHATVPGIFAAMPYCIDLIGGPYIETCDGAVKAWRPGHAVRAKPLQV